MIETSGLRKTYQVAGKGRKSVSTDVIAVDGIDLVVAAGQIFGLLGPNGAGKSTTIKMLATLVEPSGGTARVAGFDLMTEPNEIRRRIGLVSQNGGMDSEETARRELVYQGMIFGADRSTAQARAVELLDRFELTAAADRKIKTLSGGQRRRVDIASGLVHKPALLFLDEPTTGLDPQSRANLWDEIRALRNEGSTIVITTHYLDEADALCDRLAIVDHGKIVAEGTADELKAGVGGDVVTIRVPMIDLAEKVLQETIVVPGMASAMERFGYDTLRLTVPRSDTAVGPILKSLDEAGLEMAGLSTARPSLDDVFLRHTGRSLRDSAA
jgi:ABC-2 type transport system ATP-binding protein